MTKQQATWSPYDFNDGTCVAIAGADYCVVAADTRMWTGYSILTRDYSKICKLGEKSLLASSGFQADMRALQKQLAARHLIYQHQQQANELSGNGSTPFEHSLLQAFLPGCIFTYDAVGSYETVGYSSQGSSAKLIMPFLDNQLKSPSPLLLPAKDAVTPLSEVEAVDLVKIAFASATERDIYTGDKSEMVILNREGIRTEFMELRKD
ncbi:Proteasome subunit beta type-1-like protein [Drosera capensis]